MPVRITVLLIEETAGDEVDVQMSCGKSGIASALRHSSATKECLEASGL